MSFLQCERRELCLQARLYTAVIAGQSTSAASLLQRDFLMKTAARLHVGDTAMRLVMMSLLVCGLTTGACGRTNTGLDQSIGKPDPSSKKTVAAVKEPAWREVTIPAGTPLPIVLDTTVGSDTSSVEQPVEAHLARAVLLDDQIVLPEGSRVSGVVTDATRSAKVKGLAHIAIRFDTIAPVGVGEHYSILTSAVSRTAAATKEKDALEIGAPAAGGALIGALLGGKKGALIGTAVGGGAGTAVVLSTSGKEIHLPTGATLTLRLLQPVTVRIGG